MGRPRNHTPSYLPHAASGRARAVWTDPTGRRHDRLLPGPFGSPESKAAFGRLVAEVGTGAPAPAVAPGGGVTVNEVLVGYLRHADAHYRDPDGDHTSKWDEARLVARRLRDLYGDTPAAEFGPLKLKAVRQSWVADGLCRTGVNARAGMVKRVFKWAAAEELVPPATYLPCRPSPGCRRGGRRPGSRTRSGRRPTPTWPPPCRS